MSPQPSAERPLGPKKPKPLARLAVQELGEAPGELPEAFQADLPKSEAMTSI